MNMQDVLNLLMAMAAYFTVLAAGIGLAWLTSQRQGRRGGAEVMVTTIAAALSAVYLFSLCNLLLLQALELTVEVLMGASNG